MPTHFMLMFELSYMALEESVISVANIIPSKNFRFEGSSLIASQLAGATDTAASFQFTDEGHTLGNALRYVIMKK